MGQAAVKEAWNQTGNEHVLNEHIVGGRPVALCLCELGSIPGTDLAWFFSDQDCCESILDGRQAFSKEQLKEWYKLVFLLSYFLSSLSIYHLRLKQ